MVTLPSLKTLDGQLPVRVYVCTAATDMRKGFDSLCWLVREQFGHDPMCGHWFIFLSKRRDRVKILYWDADGFAIWYKRLEVGTFRLPKFDPGTSTMELKASELAMLLAGVDLKHLRRLPRYTRPAAAAAAG